MDLIFFFFIIVPLLSIHEYFHAWTANHLGDPTSKQAGRLTINPLAHIDPFGTIFLPLILLMSGGRFIFAYAKPVPFNPHLLKNKKYGPALVAMAGPLANFLVALIFGLAVRFLPVSSFSYFLSRITFYGILLAVFNLIPIPPLDGSRILFSLLPSSWFRYQLILEKYSFVFILALIFFASPIIFHLIFFLSNLIMG